MNDHDSTADLLRDSANDFLVGRPDRARLRSWIAKPRPVDRALWKECANLGWTGMLLPESLGGLGLSLKEAASVFDEAGRQLFSEPLVACSVMPALLLASAEAGPSPELAAALAQMLVDGERLLTLAWQEAPGQLILNAPSCEIKQGRLNGCKHFVQACEPDAMVLVWAHAGGEPVLLAVDAQSEGVHRSPESAGLGAQATLVFDNVHLLNPTPLLCGEAARHALAQALAGGRLALAVELSGLAAGCLSQTLDHVRTRQQFGHPLGTFQTVQHRCVDLHIEIELARASCEQALGLFSLQMKGMPRPWVGAAICAAKARAGEAAVHVGREAVQLHGAMGFCDEVDVGLYLRAALHGNAWMGGPVALRRCFSASRAQAENLQMEAAHG